MASFDIISRRSNQPQVNQPQPQQAQMQTPAAQSKPAATANPPQLRPYQADVVDGVYTKVRQGYQRIAIIAGTGAGKTVIGGKICADVAKQQQRLLFLVHLDVLVGQTYEKLQSFGLHCGFIKAGWAEDKEALIQIASIQTLAKRAEWFDWPANVVFYDEGHTTVFSQVGQKILNETHQNAIHIAMTATPYRLGSEQMGDHFPTFVAAPPPSALQDMGFLAPVKYYGLPTEQQIDLGGVRTVGGDYNEQDLKNACDRPELIKRIVEEWQRLTPAKRTIAFCVDLEHARHVAAAFNANGITAATVEGGTPPKERQRLYTELADGQLTVLTSCNVISIGFDVPAVEVGLLLRPTMSLALHYQQIGRVMRISPKTGKTHGIILDQAGNLERLGFPEDVQTYELPVGTTGTAQTPSANRAAPSKRCPQCQRCVSTVQMNCPDCGYDWAAERPVYDHDLIQLLSRDQIRNITDEPTRYRIFQAFRKRVFQKGYAPDFARQEYFDCFEVWPPDAWCEGAIFGKSPSSQEMQAYQHYLGAIAQRHGKDLTWIVQEFDKEFGTNRWREIFM
ncbi:MAG: DEAD/DEAH box helicase family protein [Cyanobacteria bacterium P01_H01_bin.121]